MIKCGKSTFSKEIFTTLHYQKMNSSRDEISCLSKKKYSLLQNKILTLNQRLKVPIYPSCHISLKREKYILNQGIVRLHS